MTVTELPPNLPPELKIWDRPNFEINWKGWTFWKGKEKTLEKGDRYFWPYTGYWDTVRSVGGNSENWSRLVFARKMKKKDPKKKDPIATIPEYEEI